ncbi:MAG TPA: HNH endonuclease [Thermoanaerobaculia bacterium]|jgi:hypothetical protein
MAIRPSDARKLWGRAGGRCSVCHREGGAEIAHIVARSLDGPRGDSPLPLEQRDLYENLVLLCPNDHSTVDSNPKEWTASRLRDIKAEHELWVQKRLEQGAIRVSEVEASAFAEERVSAWQAIEQHAWLFLSLTPLEVREEIVDPVAKSIQDLLSSLPMPRRYHDTLGTILNSNNTEPSARGLLNEDFRRLSEGVGFRAEVFRNGHVESVSCIDKLLLSEEYLMQLRPSISLSSSTHRLTECKKAIEYKELAELLLDQIQQLNKLWTDIPLPAVDMLLTAGLLNCRGACLLAFSYEEHRAFIGRCIEDRVLQYGTIVERKGTLPEIYNATLSRLVNTMGLHLFELWEGGKIPIPRHL